jgi:hypothetical protein
VALGAGEAVMDQKKTSLWSRIVGVFIRRRRGSLIFTIPTGLVTYGREYSIVNDLHETRFRRLVLCLRIRQDRYDKIRIDGGLWPLDIYLGPLDADLYERSDYGSLNCRRREQ